MKTRETSQCKKNNVSVSDEFSITILKPSHQSVWSQWLLGKQNPDITPPNLRNRSWHDFPQTEVQVWSNMGKRHTQGPTLTSAPSLQKKSPGPPLGTSMGPGLTLREGSGGSPAQRQPVRSCPKVLEIRELNQHRPISTLLKDTVDARLKVKRSH